MSGYPIKLSPADFGHFEVHPTFAEKIAVFNRVVQTYYDTSISPHEVHCPHESDNAALTALYNCLLYTSDAADE